MLEPMISYAQNFEDVLLRRAFQDVARGAYIDIGANHPKMHSVTKYFYEKGWRGVNVEPGKIFELVAEDRPEDVNLQVAVSNKSGSITYYHFPDAPGFSTCNDREAAVHRTNGHRCEVINSKMVTLAEICEKHVKDADIHFMSIDVEGHERAVLEGADWSRWRPKVVLLEATRPNTTIPTFHEWESILLDAGYFFAMFDGLNRYYVRREDAHLAELLKTPANCFDSFTQYESLARIEYIAILEQEHKRQHEAFQKMESRICEQQEQIEDQFRRLDAIDGISPSSLRILKKAHRVLNRYPKAKGAIKRLMGRAA